MRSESLNVVIARLQIFNRHLPRLINIFLDNGSLRDARIFRATFPRIGFAAGKPRGRLSLLPGMVNRDERLVY